MPTYIPNGVGYSSAILRRLRRHNVSASTYTLWRRRPLLSPASSFRGNCASSRKRRRAVTQPFPSWGERSVATVSMAPPVVRSASSVRRCQWRPHSDHCFQRRSPWYTGRRIQYVYNLPCFSHLVFRYRHRKQSQRTSRHSLHGLLKSSHCSSPT